MENNLRLFNHLLYTSDFKANKYKKGGNISIDLKKEFPLNDLENLFVNFTNTDDKYDNVDMLSLESNINNPYSDLMLGVTPDQTSFATFNPYDSMLERLSASSETQQNTNTGKISKSLSDFFNEIEPIIRQSIENHSSELGLTNQNQKELAIKCIAVQMAQETRKGTSSLWKNHNNPGGLTYTSTASNYGGQRGNKQPDGNSNYIYFNNRSNAIEMMVDGFYNKMKRYKGILAQSRSVRDFVNRIKRAGYFAGDLSTYANNCEEFGKEYDNWKKTWST